MVAFATADDVEAALGRAFTEDVDLLLEEATDLVVGYLHYAPDPVPPAVVRVVAAMVAAALTRPVAAVEGAEQMTAGPFGVRFAPDAASRGPRLTVGFKTRLNPYRSASTITLSSETPGLVWGS